MFFLNQENIKLHPPSQNTVTVKLFYISVHFAVIRLEKKNQDIRQSLLRSKQFHYVNKAVNNA